MTERDKITLELAKQYDDVQVLVFLETIDGIRKCDIDYAAENKRHLEQLNTLANERRRLQYRCSHPLVYKDSGGQYQSISTWCRICGAEL